MKDYFQESLLSILCFIILRKRSQEKGLMPKFMTRNLFSCVWFLTRGVFLVGIDAMEQESLFLPLIANMLFVSMGKGWKRYFGGFVDLS